MLRPESIAADLPTLPQQPEGVPWPTRGWQSAAASPADAARFSQLADEIFDLEGGERGVTYALLAVKNGELVFERYDHGANAFYLQYSWSMAKSVTQALAGILANQGRLDIYAPAAVPEWKDDERSEITLDQLLRMSSGLKFNEDYVDGGISDVIPMLQLEGRHDTGAFAASMPLEHAPGSHWSYSSGTTNIICRILRDVVGGGASGMLRFMNDELFEPLGIRSATPKFDTSGTFIGSSFMLMTPQDFARFGMLYLRGGNWDGRQILPAEWVDYARSPTFVDSEQAYGAQWWMKPDDTDVFYAGGYDGQRIACFPDNDVVMVRLGRTPVDQIPWVWDRYYEMASLL